MTLHRCTTLFDATGALSNVTCLPSTSTHARPEGSWSSRGDTKGGNNHTRNNPLGVRTCAQIPSRPSALTPTHPIPTHIPTHIPYRHPLPQPCQRDRGDSALEFPLPPAHRHPKVAALGGSDFHRSAAVGQCDARGAPPTTALPLLTRRSELPSSHDLLSRAVRRRRVAAAGVLPGLGVRAP